MRRVLFTGLYPYWSYHFTAELNLVEQELAAGSEVYMLACDEVLQSCECNYQHEKAICTQCIGVRREGFRRLSSSITVLPFIAEKYLEWSVPEAGRPFNDVDELRKFYFEGFDAGMAVVSSLIDRAQSVAPDMTKFGNVITRLILDTCRTFRTAIDYLEQYGFDEVAIFNGRFAASKPWARACQLKNVPFFTHERTGNPKRIRKYRQSFPHEPTQYAALVREHEAATKDDPECRAEAERFFLERPKGILSSWWSFVDKQTPGSLPDGFDTGRKNIAIFSSTEFEFTATSDLFIRQEEFRRQAETMLGLSRGVYAQDPGCFFYLRIHPNSASVEDRWWEGDAFRNASNIAVIPPESPLSSYALMYACDLVVAWGSNTGVEATFWGKPSILLGPSFYAGIDAVYEPQTMLEAVELIVHIPPPKDRENAIAYGSLLMTGGTDLPFSEVINHYEITFKGTGLWETTPEPELPAVPTSEPAQNSVPSCAPPPERPFPTANAFKRLGRALFSKRRPE